MNHQDIHSSKYSGDDRPSKNRQGKFPEGFLQKVKETVNLIEIIGEHVVLKKSGSNYTGLCPFHSERTPSFSVNEIKQLYHCYGCKKGGDVITFTMEILGVDFLDAIEELAEKARVALPGGWRGASDDPEREKKRSVQREKEALAFKLNRFAAAFFHQNLFNSASAMEYLMKRGVDQEWMKIFYIGMAPDGWDSLVNHLQTKKAPLELAAELGLIRPSTKSIGSGKGYFDLFRNRILFPILNLRGKVAGFGGRALSDSDTPKYLNSPESLIYQKSKLVFGLYQAQKFIREQDEVILVEGYFDVLAMQMAGFRNVVATCGTALTPDHLSLFKRFARRVTLLFDGDRAGISATERAMEIGLEQGWVLYGAKIPEGKDPDEVLFDLNTGLPHSQGKEKMKAILQDAKALLDEAMSENIQVAQKGPEERVQALKRMGGWLARFQDSVGREVRVQLIQKQLGVSRQLVEEAMGLKGGNLRDKKSGVTFLPQGSPERGGGVKESQSRGERNNLFINQGDRILLSGIAFGGEYVRILSEARKNLPPKMTLCDLFEFPPARVWVNSLLSKPGLLEQVREIPDQVMSQEVDEQVRSIMTEAWVAGSALYSEADFRRAIFRSLAKNWARFSQQIKRAIAEAESKKDAELQNQLMKDYLDVQRKMKEFSSFYDEA